MGFNPTQRGGRKTQQTTEVHTRPKAIYRGALCYTHRTTTASNQCRITTEAHESIAGPDTGKLRSATTPRAPLENCEPYGSSNLGSLDRSNGSSASSWHRVPTLEPITDTRCVTLVPFSSVTPTAGGCYQIVFARSIQ
jgi:hypothetical protein